MQNQKIILNAEKHSSVNWRKVLGNYRGSYNFSEEWEITILELIANSVDAKATKIDLQTRLCDNSKYCISCQDNGIGMNEKDFFEYHNLGSLTKAKTGQTIGFAGIGAKLCIDLCESIYTETSNGKQLLASEWRFDKNDIEPKYKFIEPLRRLKNKTGTYVEIRNIDNKELKINKIKELLLENYEYALAPYGKLILNLNNETIKSTLPSKERYKHHYFNIIIKKNKKLDRNISIEGHFFFVDDKYLDEIKNQKTNFTPGINIVVLGKTILKNEYFGLITDIKYGHAGYLTGYISSNELIEITKTSKDDLNKKSNLWFYFLRESKEILKNWLLSIGELSEKKDYAKEHTDVITVIEENLNIILNNFPELLQGIPFLSPLKKPTPVVNPNGELSGTQTDLGEYVGGTFGGEGDNPDVNVPTIGTDEGPGVKLDQKGKLKVDTPKKKLKGPRISVLPDEGKKEPIWFDVGIPGFVINGAHPAYYISSRDPLALDTYMTYILFNFLVDIQETIKEDQKREYVWNLYSTYLSQLR